MTAYGVHDSQAAEFALSHAASTIAGIAQ